MHLKQFTRGRELLMQNLSIYYSPQQRDTILTCLASSRVGTSTTTLGALPYCLFVDLKLSFKLNDSRIGNTNANDFPCKFPQCQVQHTSIFSKRAKLHNQTFTFRNGLRYQCLYTCQSTKFQLHKISVRTTINNKTLSFAESN